MSSYTMELKKLFTPDINGNSLYTREEVENFFKSYNIEDYLLPDQVAQLQKFPNIWSKDKLAKKIVDHYYMREIGYDTPAMFEHYAKIKMEEIMEEKLPLIYTTALSYNPLINVDYTEEFSRTANQEGNGSSSSESNSNSSGLAVNSDTPQGQINKQSILNGSYASSTGASESESTIEDSTSSTTSQQTEESYTRHLTGNQGISATYQAMIKQFRENIVAVDKQIIEELNSLFMGIY